MTFEKHSHCSCSYSDERELMNIWRMETLETLMNESALLLLADECGRTHVSTDTITPISTTV